MVSKRLEDRLRRNMKALIQRVKHANVIVDDIEVSRIGLGLLVFLGVGEDDEQKDLDYLLSKVPGLRVFSDENGKMNLSLAEVNGSMLVVSQFTLYADTKKGKRPSFTKSASPVKGEEYYNAFIKGVRSLGLEVRSGVFGGDMKVSLLNDGPVTILIDSKERS